MRARRWWVICGVWGAVACGVRPETRGEATCPPCECKCECEAEVAAAPGQLDPLQQASQAEIGELVASATRKMNFDDGAGCLADLDRVAAIDPKAEARLAVTRGMCEMLVGRCQEGKQRVARWYQDETNMHPERAATTAEQIAAMRCRGGDSSDRDRLLRAYFELSDGAYMNKKTAAECQAALDVARALIPKVQPNGPDDSQIRDTPRALFHSAATCFGRAGDCQTALKVFRELNPDLSGVSDPATREKIVRESFDASIVHCAADAAGKSR